MNENNLIKPLLIKKTTDTITKLVMVIMGLVLVLLETVMTLLVSTLVIGGLLKPINPKGICPKTHYRKQKTIFQLKVDGLQCL